MAKQKPLICHYKCNFNPIAKFNAFNLTKTAVFTSVTVTMRGLATNLWGNHVSCNFRLVRCWIYLSLRFIWKFWYLFKWGVSFGWSSLVGIVFVYLCEIWHGRTGNNADFLTFVHAFWEILFFQFFRRIKLFPLLYKLSRDSIVSCHHTKNKAIPIK